MRTIAFVFAYNRGETLHQCLYSLLHASKYVPDEVIVIDDGSTDENVLNAIDAARSFSPRVKAWMKGANRGLSDSAQMAFEYAKQEAPDYVFLIEGDYVYRARGMDDLMDLFLNTTQGRSCLGVAGYDHPNFYSWQVQTTTFPQCMIQQVGEDNVNRQALHKPFYRGSGQYAIELVSNTCWTSYLDWRNLEKVGREFPELWDLLDQAVWPRDNPNYPDSGKYKAARVVDDGMLSHALSLCWNNWAMAHNFDRTQHAAWLNIKPSIAQHVYAGGMHS
jgi:glycosyltransferase involved in cell wall biosynthesis